MKHEPIVHQTRRAATIGALLLACGVGAHVAWADGWHAPSAADPTEPVLLLARLVLLILSVWVAGATMVVVAAQLLRLTSACEAAAKMLPSVVRSVVLRSIATPAAGIGLAGTLVFSPAAAAALPGIPTPTAVAQAGGDVTNGQQWPTGPGGRAPLLDPEAPVLRAPGTRASTSKLPAVVPTNNAALADAPVHPTSAPSPGQHSVPIPTAPSTSTSTSTSTSIVSIPPVSSHTLKRHTQVPTFGVAKRSVASAAFPVTSTYSVKPGDHFWSIAEHVVLAGNPDADEAHVRRYWIRLVEANLTKLRDRSNPDLLHVGTQLTIPAVEPL